MGKPGVDKLIYVTHIMSARRWKNHETTLASRTPEFLLVIRPVGRNGLLRPSMKALSTVKECRGALNPHTLRTGTGTAQIIP
jgi:hypothetical protein